LRHFDRLRLGLAKPRLEAERLPSGCVTQLVAEIRPRENVRPRRSKSAHDGKAVRLQNAARLSERDDRLGPE
jgi:hypothetical protein